METHDLRRLNHRRRTQSEVDDVRAEVIAETVPAVLDDSLLHAVEGRSMLHNDAAIREIEVNGDLSGTAIAYARVVVLPD